MQNIQDVPDEGAEKEEIDKNVIQHLTASSRAEELARRLVQLQQEFQKQKRAIKRQSNKIKLLLNQKVEIAKHLNLLELVEKEEHKEGHPQVTNKALSAFPSKIDKDWKEVYSDSASWRGWWESGRP